MSMPIPLGKDAELRINLKDNMVNIVFVDPPEFRIILSTNYIHKDLVIWLAESAAAFHRIPLIKKGL